VLLIRHRARLRIIFARRIASSKASPLIKKGK